MVKVNNKPPLTAQEFIGRLETPGLLVTNAEITRALLGVNVNLSDARDKASRFIGGLELQAQAAREPDWEFPDPLPGYDHSMTYRREAVVAWFKSRLLSKPRAVKAAKAAK